MKPLCIYHGNCADGFTSAWIVNKALKEEVSFFPGVYQREPPLGLCEGRPVIFVDFAYRRDVMKQIAAVASFVLVLDHHKSAMLDMAELPNEAERIADQIFHSKNPRDPDVNWEGLLSSLDHDSEHDIYCVYDLERSGAGLAWDFFNPGEPRPQLVEHVQDRDLWKFALNGTREIQANVFSYEYTFENWDSLEWKVKNYWDDMFAEGEAIERKHHKDIKELLEIVTRPMRFWTPEGEMLVPVANLPYTMVSDGGMYLLERNIEGRPAAPGSEPYKQPFSACYYDGPNGRNFSFRSDGLVDVSKVAAHYGGGGHPKAAGCRVPFDQLVQFEDFVR